MNYTNTYKTSVKFIATASVIVTAFALMVLPSIAKADSINRQLETGMTGSDVSTLQTFLAQDPTMYPQGLVTGYFGFLTKAAVSNFQTRNGLDSVGRVGPLTLPVLNLQIANGMHSTTYGRAPSITSVAIGLSNNNATVNWNTDELAKGVVYYSTSPLGTYERENSVDITGSSVMTDTSLKFTQNVSIPNLQANTTYYFMIYSTDQAGNVSVTWPSTFHTSN
jgi:Putative peptidoglycan binding domain/Purple acid Phosphatase, N-terminal domain